MIRLLLCVTLLWASPVRAASRTVCVYDPGGKAGDYYRMLEGWALAASGWGVEVELKAYTDEETASKDYEAGHCDGVVATGVRLQRYNHFPSTLEAIGALPTYDLLRSMVRTLATYESAARKLRKGEHETVGIIPVGAVYLFVRDRNIDQVPDLAGKRVATLDYDKASMQMVGRVGAIVVPADLGSMGPKFNNGDVDACYVSAPGYQPFELWRGLDSDGGVLRAPLAQATLQVLVRADRFPEGFGAHSRKYLFEQFDQALSVVKKAEADIPTKYWIEVPDATMGEWEEMFLGVRIKLRDEVGVYDGAMLGAMRKLRCIADGSRAECIEKEE